MKKLRVVFMGTPDFAVANLEAILNSVHQIVGVVTAPDKPAGRGLKIHLSAVKIYAQKNKLNLLQPTHLKDPDFIAQLTALKPDVQVVVAFRMLPKVVWSLAPTFNLHASLLPDYRGAAPIHWAIINGEKKTGVSTFFIDEKIDTGMIILQKETAIKPDENLGALYQRLMKIGSALTVETLDLLGAGKPFQTTAQPPENRPTAPKLSAENCAIDWNENIANIYNKIRGLNPFPVAKTTLQNGTQTIATKIFEATKENADHQKNNGSITVVNKKLKVAVSGGFIVIESLQIAGKKRVSAKDFLNGFPLQNGATFF